MSERENVLNVISILRNYSKEVLLRSGFSSDKKSALLNDINKELLILNSMLQTSEE